MQTTGVGQSCRGHPSFIAVHTPEMPLTVASDLARGRHSRQPCKKHTLPPKTDEEEQIMWTKNVWPTHPQIPHINGTIRRPPSPSHLFFTFVGPLDREFVLSSFLSSLSSFSCHSAPQLADMWTKQFSLEGIPGKADQVA